MRKSFIVAAIVILDTTLCRFGLLAADQIVGRWLEHVPNAHIKMDETVQRNFGGWQTSDLTFDVHMKTWWSIGDQNCRERAENFPAGESHRGRFIYRLPHISPHPQAEPVPIWWQRKDPEFTTVDASFHSTGTGFIDFEGIAADPTTPHRLFACTEGPQPWLVEIEFREVERKAVVTRTVRISTQGNHDRDRNGRLVEADPNKRWEGIAVSPDGKTIFLATEWVDSPARIYSVPMTDFRKGDWERDNNGKWIPPKVFPAPFVATGIEGELTGLCFVPRAGKNYLVALERNTPKKSLPPSLYFIDMAVPQAPPHRIALDLRAPALDGRKQGTQIKSASPEGIATDGEGRLVLISDPDGTFYRPTETGSNEDKLRNLIPLVFDTHVVSVWP